MNRTFDPPAISHSRRITDRSPAVAGSSRGVASEQALFRLDLMRSLRMHRRLAIGFAVVGVVLAVLYVAKYWSVYTAECLVYIQPTPSAVMDQQPMHWPYNYDPATYDSYIEQQMSSMTRPDVLAGAVRMLQPGVWRQSGESDESAADRMKGAVEVARVGTSYQVAITAHARNAETAAALANAVAASYIENTSHEQKAGDAERLAMLKEERERIKKELDDDRSEQATLNAQLGVAAIGPEAPEHYDSDIAQVHDELVKARADHDEAAARLASLNSGNGPSSAALDAEADKMLDTDPGLSSLKQALLARRAALVSQMANLTPSHPQYKQDQEELQKIDASLESSTRELRAKAAARIEQQLRTDLERTAGYEARLNGEIAQMTRAAAGETPKLQRSSDLANDITRLQTRFNTVDEQLQNQTLEDKAPGTAHVAEAAVAPAHASVAGVIRNALILLLGFIGLGLAAAVAAHKLDRRVYVASDVEQLLGYGPMAQLPDFDEVSDEVAEAHLLRLASGLEYACKNGQLTSCVFTGAGPGVGVTTITKRVKQILGALGAETVLVNATGSVPAEFESGVNGAPAMTGAELKRSSLSAALSGHAGEGAASDREVMILTDTAPLSVSAEAEYLTRRADCTILVIESGATTRAQLRAAAESLQRMDAAAVGFVLNRVSLKNADESFRLSVSEVERHLRVQGRTTARTVAQGTRVVPETALVSPVRETPALASPAETPETPATADRVGAASAPPSTPLSAPSPFVVAEDRESQPLPKPAPVVAADERETQALAHAASAYSAAQSVRQARMERVVVSPTPLPKSALFALVERWEAQHLQEHTPFMPEEDREAQPLPHPAPLAPVAQLEVEPAPSSVASAKQQTLDETVTLPIPERMPVITGSHEALKPEPEPMASYQVDHVAEPTHEPDQAILPKLAAKAAEEPKKQPTQWLPKMRPAQQPAATKPTQAPTEENPWWLSEAPKQAEAETALIQPRASRMGIWHSATANGEQNPAATEKQRAESETPTRLSGLRGLLFPLGIKDSGAKKDDERIKNGNWKSDAILHAPQAAAPAADPDQTVVIEAAKPQPIQEPVHARTEGAVARGAEPRWVTAEPEFLPPREEAAEKSNEPALKKSRHDEDAFDDIQILPARRGQYRR